jgi:hypothetical protein
MDVWVIAVIVVIIGISLVYGHRFQKNEQTKKRQKWLIEMIRDEIRHYNDWKTVSTAGKSDSDKAFRDGVLKRSLWTIKYFQKQLEELKKGSCSTSTLDKIDRIAMDELKVIDEIMAKKIKRKAPQSVIDKYLYFSGNRS